MPEIAPFAIRYITNCIVQQTGRGKRGKNINILKVLWWMAALAWVIWVVGYPIYRRKKKMRVFANGNIYRNVSSLLTLCILIFSWGL